MQSPGAHQSTRISGPSVTTHGGVVTARSSTMPNGLACLLSSDSKPHVAGGSFTQLRNSPHLGAAELPHGMIGTVEVEFCGDPSTTRSELVR